MADYVIFTKVVTLTLIFIRFSPKNFARVLGTEYISCQNFRKIEQWCGLYIVQLRTDRQTNKQTDRQTDRQTNRGDQYTLQKSTILQSNKQTNRQTDRQTNRGDQYTCKNLRFCKVMKG